MVQCGNAPLIVVMPIGFATDNIDAVLHSSASRIRLEVFDDQGRLPSRQGERGIEPIEGTPITPIHGSMAQKECLQQSRAI